MTELISCSDSQNRRGVKSGLKGCLNDSDSPGVGCSGGAASVWLQSNSVNWDQPREERIGGDHCRALRSGSSGVVIWRRRCSVPVESLLSMLAGEMWSRADWEPAADGGAGEKE